MPHAQPRTMVMLAFDGMTLLDLTGPMEVFHTATQAAARLELEDPGYRLVVCTPDGGTARSTHGLQIAPDAALASMTREPVHTLLVAGGAGAREVASDAETLAAVRAIAAHCTRTVAVCTGAFVLAAAGLLRDRRATTHWRYCATLARAYPDTEVVATPIFVRDGPVATSAGVVAGIDLALALVEEDMGRDVALQVARWLVLYVRRPSRQSQLSAPLAAQLSEHDAIRALQHHIVEHADAELSVSALASRVGMSPRNFARVFKREVGQTPGAYVERVRLEVAQRLLEHTCLDMTRVAEAAGFGTPQVMRRAFARRLNTSPSAFRAEATTPCYEPHPPWTSPR